MFMTMYHFTSVFSETSVAKNMKNNLSQSTGEPNLEGPDPSGYYTFQRSYSSYFQCAQK